jgi:hypothetical protein
LTYKQGIECSKRFTEKVGRLLFDLQFSRTFKIKAQSRETLRSWVNESAVVGDIDIKYRVYDDGSFNLHVFNKENDINYVGQEIGYTQGGGLIYEVDFDTFRELVDKMFKSKKLTKPTKDRTDVENPDSNLNPDFINFSKPDSPKSEKPKINQDGVLPEVD